MTLHAPESDASKTRRRFLKTKRRPDDGEGVALDCPSVTFGVRGAPSKRDGALAKPNVVPSIQGVVFSSARATSSIRDDTFCEPSVTFTKPSGAPAIHRSTPSIQSASFSTKKCDEVFQKTRSRLTRSKSTRNSTFTNKEEDHPKAYRQQFHSSRYGFTQTARQGGGLHRVRHGRRARDDQQPHLSGCR
jgi:hypothetical protein